MESYKLRIYQQMMGSYSMSRQKVLMVGMVVGCVILYRKLIHSSHMSSGAIITLQGKDVHLDEAVFVTAFDASHFEESKDSIASIQTNLPLSHKILYYDLGLTADQITEIKSWCRVNYVKFDASKYPPHVGNLRSYAWKPLIIQEVLRSHNAVVWFDTSARFKCPDFMNQMAPTLRKGGVAVIEPHGHSIYTATHPDMYKYLPKNLSSYRKTEMFGAALYVILNTPAIVENVLKPLVKCSLTKKCIFPEGSTTKCKFQENRYTQYANCHKYDESALNILLHALFKGDVAAYFADNTCATVERRSTSYFELQMCN